MPPQAPFNPVFLPPWIGLPLPKTLTPSQAIQLYGHIRTVAFYLDAITALVPQTRDSPIQVRSVGPTYPRVTKLTVTMS